MISRIHRWMGQGTVNAALALAVVLVPVVFAARSAQAKTENVVYRFNGPDGAQTVAGLIQDPAGNFYGTTIAGGTYGAGTVFKLTPTGRETILYSFTGGADGAEPFASLIQDSAGNLYGTTITGGNASGNCAPFGNYVGCGVVFEVTPSGNASVLYSFTGGNDGGVPQGSLAIDSAGNLYGTTELYGANSRGVVFKVNPNTATETVIYSFQGGSDAQQPVTGLMWDTQGNLYGMSFRGGANNCGTIFKVDPAAGTESVFYSFQCGGAGGVQPQGNLIIDANGNLYGVTSHGGVNGTGTVFEVTPSGIETTLYTFAAANPGDTDGQWPQGPLARDAAGSLYGVTFYGGVYGWGTVFELTAAGTKKTLYSFTGGVDGAEPEGGVILDRHGNPWGTTYTGGNGRDGPGFGFGLVFKMGATSGLTFAPDPLNAGNQAVNTTSAAKSVTLKNTGKSTLDIASITVNGDFAISSDTCGTTLPAGSLCTVGVTFTPTTQRYEIGTLSVTDNSPSSPQLLPLAGTGIADATLTPTSADFGTVKVGTTSPAQTFTLTNQMNVALTGIAISATSSLGGNDYVVSATTCKTSLAPKGHCTISVTFTPSATGWRPGRLSVSDSGNNSPQIAGLTGVGD